MTSVIYPLGSKSRWQNNEIRFSLRSVEKHLRGVLDVWIVGERPDFLININHIPANDQHDVPDRNIMEKIKKACDHPEISDPFLFFNDDHFLLSDFQAEEFPYYYDATIWDKIAKRGYDGYGQRMQNTMKHLQSNGKPIKNFDIHTPILYHKQKFLDTVTNVDWEKKNGFVIKSLYCNMLEIEGTYMKDCKHNYPVNTPCYSTFPKVPPNIQKFLLEKFPNPSKFEQWEEKESPVISESQKDLATR